MRGMFTFFQTVHQNVWGGSIFEWLFYISILFILVFEKKREVKIIFALYSIAFHIIVYNPLTYKVLSMFFTGELSAYYCRLFEMVPIIFCIAQGMMIVVSNTKTWWGELITVLVLSVAVVIIGADSQSFRMPWMQPAENIQKVPDGLIEICRTINNEKDSICVAAPSSLSGYVRQVDASLYTPYGRDVNELGEALDEADSPDVNMIMQNAGQYDCNYIIAINNENIINAYKAAGYSPYMQTSDYLVYSVKGVPRTERNYNNKRQMISCSYYDAEGNPTKSEGGYYTACYEYDSKGDQIKEYYLDMDGNLMMCSSGYAIIERTYYPISGFINTIAFKDVNGELAETKDGYSKIVRQYNNRLLVKELFYDAEGNAI